MTDSNDENPTNTNLLTKYSKPKGNLHRLANHFMVFYLIAGFAMPLAGGASFLVWMNTHPGVPANTNLVILSMVTMAAAYFWMFLTIFAIPVFISGRKFLGLAPAAMYGLGIATMAFVPSNELSKTGAEYIAFAVLAFFASRCQIQVFKQILAEPNIKQPALLGCHGDLHNVDEISASE